jgi:hypothetical protein
MPDYANQGLDIGVKRRFTLICPMVHDGSLR